MAADKLPGLAEAQAMSPLAWAIAVMRAHRAEIERAAASARTPGQQQTLELLGAETVRAAFRAANDARSTNGSTERKTS